MVHVIDDDKLVREGLSRLLRSQGYDVHTFPSATTFLDTRPELIGPTCVVLDVMMPGKTGLELQDELRSLHSLVPVVFISGQGNIPMTVRALQGGASTFLEKPLDPDELLEAVATAIDQHREMMSEEQELAKIRRRVGTLSSREREVLSLVVTGLLNKQIAARLGIVLRTVKAHRHQIMKKMAVASVAELVRSIERIEWGRDRKA